jgi:Icc-related predicted phosphoesterase
MTKCFFVSDLHGHIDRYDKLFRQIKEETPDAVFFGGDLLPHALKKIKNYNDFVTDYLFPQFYRLKHDLKNQYPQIFLILGNDDARSEEDRFIAESQKGLFQYINQQKVMFREYPIYGYSFVPPTPFQMKDWEKYDVSRYVDPGCIHPTEGFRTTEPNEDIEYATIKNDLDTLIEIEDCSNAILLSHSPPYKTNLDRAALDGKMIDYVPLDVHVGSIAIQRFIEERQPLITLHGHIHESTRLTGSWNQKIGKTFSFNAAHDGPELAIIKFDLEEFYKATRVLY